MCDKIQNALHVLYHLGKSCCCIWVMSSRVELWNVFLCSLFKTRWFIFRQSLLIVFKTTQISYAYDITYFKRQLKHRKHCHVKLSLTKKTRKERTKPYIRSKGKSAIAGLCWEWERNWDEWEPYLKNVMSYAYDVWVVLNIISNA